jgi:Asp-tRNA(Asn)/Glu-tRNA(Gln) amidotransferase A subunit family amidase
VNGQTFVLHNPVQDGAVEADKQNPYILDHNPCGSSAGSAVAVAANLCVVAVGTETDGSVVCPSAVSGIVGIKPTIGLVSRSGIIPYRIQDGWTNGKNS